LLIGVGVANASSLIITLTSTAGGGGVGKTFTQKAGGGVWTFKVDFTPDSSARRLFIDLIVKGVDVYSIHICTDQQLDAGLCYLNQGKNNCLFVTPGTTGLPDFTSSPAALCSNVTNYGITGTQAIIQSPNLPAGSYTLNVILSDIAGDGLLSSVTVTIASP